MKTQKSKLNLAHGARFTLAFGLYVSLMSVGIGTGGVIMNTVSAGTVTLQPKAGEPLVGLTPSEHARFLAGKVRYEHNFTAEEGLGPVFNKQSCGNCHSNPVGGTGTQFVTRFGLNEKGSFNPLDEYGGSLLQAQANSDECAESIPNLPGIVTAKRITNGMMGYGLVEAISDNDILAVRDGQLAKTPSLAGIAHMVPSFEDEVIRVGRFGHKAQVATLLTFSADAGLNEIGLTNQFLPVENDPNGIYPPELSACDAVPDPEDTPVGKGTSFIEMVADFQRLMAAPPQTPKSGMTGEALFNNIGCADCHFPSYTTRDDANLEEAIRNKTIRPYSDFLLHDMGLAADFIEQGGASVQHIRTPPLWGLRLRQAMWHHGEVDEGTFSSKIQDPDTGVIALHRAFGSQAKPSADQFFDVLTQPQRDAVVAFLNSLGRREFDLVDNLDDAINIEDFALLANCVGGGPYTADDACAVADVNQDGFVNQADFDAFLAVYDGPMGDCNGNGILDLQDIVSGTAQDTNDNGIPDSCEPTCIADTNGTGTVDVDDLLAVINGWGECSPSPAPCPADIDGDGAVNVDDLLDVINLWGACK